MAAGALGPELHTLKPELQMTCLLLFLANFATP